MRLQNLDVLRALAVLLVIGTHLEGNPIHAWYIFGWTGVDLFFVLSGFLVSGLLFREYQHYGTITPGRFLMRRGLKIYPAFYFFIAVSLVAQHVHGGTFRLRDLLGESLFIQNYGWHMWPHTWSLAVEEHFYLLLALGLSALVWSGGRHLVQRTPQICWMLLIFVPFLRWAGVEGWLRLGDPLRATQFRIDALALGVLISYYHHFHHDGLHSFVRRNRVLLFTSPIFCFLPFFLYQPEHNSRVALLLSLVAIGYGCILLLTLWGDLQVPAFLAPAWRYLAVGSARIGRDSYSIYLWHLAVIYVLAGPLKTTGQTLSWGVVLLNVAGCILAGMVTAAIIERPVLRLRDRILPSRALESATAFAATAGEGAKTVAV